MQVFTDDIKDKISTLHKTKVTARSHAIIDHMSWTHFHAEIFSTVICVELFDWLRMENMHMCF